MLTKTIKRCLAVGLLVMSLYAHSRAFSNSTPLEISIALPQSLFITQVLDLRDAQNRPIHSAALQMDIQAVMMNRLNQMLRFNLTPRVQLLHKFLARQWDVFSDWLRAAGREIRQEMARWIQKHKFKILFATNGQSARSPTHQMAHPPSKNFTPHTLYQSLVIISTHLLR